LVPSIGLFCIAGWASTSDHPISKKAVARFKAKHGVRPNDTVMIGGYTNAFVLLNALKATGGNTDPEKLRAAILDLNLKDTPMGPLRFTLEGLGIINMHFMKTARAGDNYQGLGLCLTHNGLILYIPAHRKRVLTP